MVEYQLPKLATGVRFPSLAPEKRDTSHFSIFLAFVKMGCVPILTLLLAGCAALPVKPHTIGMMNAAARPPVGDFSAKGPFLWPVSGEVISQFGAKVDYIKNKGIDIHAPEGADVRASRAGRVVFRDDKFKGFGKTVILDHGGGLQTVYAYNSEILVSVGDEVRAGEVIAKAGRTGRSKSSALHFEIRRSGIPQDPLKFLQD